MSSLQIVKSWSHFGQPVDLSNSNYHTVPCVLISSHEVHSVEVCCRTNALDDFWLWGTRVWSLLQPSEVRPFQLFLRNATKQKLKIPDTAVISSKYRERRSIDATLFYHRPMEVCVMVVKKAKAVVLCLEENLFQSLTAGGRGDGGNLARLWCRRDSHSRQCTAFGSGWFLKSLLLDN